MSRMSELDAELNRLTELDMAVRCYLSHLAAVEQGSQNDLWPLEHWREQLELLTSGEMAEVI
jgi:hypothetical protein